ncbi:MAG: DUF58 domain-containing protein [Opitutales bacterium]|nr:DUF58 domain-containing protein [Opitutales bacterium]
MDARTKEMLKKVRTVEIQTRRIVHQVLTGSYRSAFKGSGIDFEEVREYCYGDDVRAIDWNVTARSDQTFIKKFREERELSILLVLDLSASGAFGSSGISKREYAAELASALAFSAALNNDKVGLVLFTDRIEKVIYPQKGRKHVLRILREILFFEPVGRGTNIVGALHYVSKMMRKRSVVFLLSDFLQFDKNVPQSTKDQPLFRALRLAGRKHDLICGILSDPRESILPSAGYVEFEDAESGDTIEINTRSKRFRKKYEDVTAALYTMRDTAFRQSGLDTMQLRTDSSYLKALRLLFARRSGRHT